MTPAQKKAHQRLSKELPSFKVKAREKNDLGEWVTPVVNPQPFDRYWRDKNRPLSPAEKCYAKK